MSSSVDLTGLPEVQFCELDTAKIESAMITTYEAVANTVLYPGDPVRLWITTQAAYVAQLHIIIDYTGKQNLLRYAEGAYLEHLGALLQVGRQDAKAAKTVVRFTLQTAQPAALIIPAGVRVTADGKIYFATDALCIVPAGSLTADIAATCQIDGTDGNGLLAGQINKLVDPQAYVAKVENTTTTSGGADVESDDSLRNRIRLQPESFTTAGSTLSYVFWALSAHQDVADVSVVSPVPGTVNVLVLLSGGRVPEVGGAELEAVTNAVSAEKRRPLTDQVSVMPVAVETVDYTVTWFITEAQSSRVAEIQDGIAAAVAEYEAWQTVKIGRDINPDKLVRLCVGAGAKRVELDGLAFTPLDGTQVTQIAERADRIRFGGIEGE